MTCSKVWLPKADINHLRNGDKFPAMSKNIVMDTHSAVGEVDPVTLAVFTGVLDSTIREMTITMRRAAMSPVLAIGNDFSNCIADGNARVIAQGEDQPVHLGAIIYAVKEVANYFADDLAPGDIIYH